MISKKKLKELQKLETERTKVCNICGKIKPLVDFTIHPTSRKFACAYCLTCQRIKDYKKRYDMTLRDYEKLLKKQNNKCAICGSTEIGDKSRMFFSVDHDHKTGKVRGLLCVHCNHGLGGFKDNPESLVAAAAYLLQHKDKK